MFTDGADFGFSAAKAGRTSAFSIATGGSPGDTIPLLTADLEWDFGSHWTVTSGTEGKITLAEVGASGAVLVTCFIEFASNGTGDRGMELLINSGRNDVARINTATGKPARLWFSTILPDRAVGDVLELAGWQTSGGALDVTKASLSILVYP